MKDYNWQLFNEQVVICTKIHIQENQTHKGA